MKLTLEAINQAIAVLFFVCYAYQFVYIPVALLRRRKRLPAAAPHRFAVLIAARNEETVIGDLLDSLHAQDYDMSLITVFVIADNCTDRTAAIASEKGAVVYTRQNKQAVGKGYALEALLAHIKSDYPDGYDAYLVFDADNLLAPDFLTRMNESFPPAMRSSPATATVKITAAIGSARAMPCGFYGKAVSLMARGKRLAAVAPFPAPGSSFRRRS